MGSSNVKYIKSNEEKIEAMIRKGVNLTVLRQLYNIRQIYEIIVEPVYTHNIERLEFVSSYSMV